MKKIKDISNGYFFADGHLNNESIALYAEALAYGMREQVPEEILIHVEQCQECKKKVFAVQEEIKSGYKLNQEIFKDTYNLANGEKGTLKTFSFTSKIAAAIILFLGISGALYFIFRDKEKPVTSGILSGQTYDSLNESNNISGKTIDTTIQQNNSPKNKDQHFIGPKKELLAVNMKESEFFEKLISTTFRKDESFDVIEPTIGKLYHPGQKIEFKTRGDLTVPIELSVYSNTNERIIRIDSITVHKFILKTQLSYGLYYWKIRKDGNLIHVGKFYVK